MEPGPRRWLLVAVFALVAGLLTPGPIGKDAPARAAAVFDVDSDLDTADAVPGDGTCDDGAGNCTLRAAVEEANALAGEDTINVPAGLYDLASPLFPSDDLVVVGAGAATTELFANSNYSSVFVLENGPVSLNASGFTYTNSGGGDCIFVDDNNDAATSAAGSTITVSDSVFDHCGDAGILAATDSGAPGAGGPVFITVTDTDFIGGGDTSCGDPDGGCYGVLIDSYGGSFTADNITVTNTRYDGLLLAFNFGDGVVDIQNSAIDENLSVGIEIFVAAEYGVDVTMHNSSVSRNSYGPVPFQGMWGGNENSSWTITDSMFVDNNRWAFQLEGAATIERIVVSGNGFGTSGTEEGSGGELFGPGIVEVRDSVFAGNAGYGLGLWGQAGTVASVVNSTFTGNKWGLASDGDSLDVVNSTIVGNLDWGAETYSDTSTFVNSIVYGNTVECLANVGQLVSLGHNIAGDATCGFAEASDMVGVDPMVGPLQDNGGPTQTMAIGTGSPALDAGDNTACPDADQRGVPRPADGDNNGSLICDIGAFELPGSVGVPVVVIDWDLDTADPRLAGPSDVMQFQLISGAGLDAWAEVEVLSWYPGGDPGAGSFLGADLPVTVTVPLLEVGDTGVYTGQLEADGVSQFVSVTGKADNGSAVGEDTAPDGLPIDVGGVVDVTTALPVPAWMLGDSRAVISDPVTGAGDVVGVPAAGAASTRPLPQSPYYGLTILDGANHTAFVDPTPVEVRGGLRAAVDVIGTPVVHVPFSIEVVDFNAAPVEGAFVSVIDDATGDEIAHDVTGPDGLVSGVASSADITVHIDPLGLPFSMTSRDITLTALFETVPVDLGSILPTSIVSGTVYRLGTTDTVPGIPISFTTELADGRLFTTTSTSVGDGTYEAEVFDGGVLVEAMNAFAGNASESLVLAGNTTVDLYLDGPLPGQLNVELLTRFAGESVPTQVPIEWRAAVHFDLEATSGAFNGTVKESPFELPVVVGRPITVCADGVEGGLSAECVEVYPDPSTLVANASLELTQAGRVTASLRLSNGTTPTRWDAQVYAVDADGTRTFVSRQLGASPSLSVGLVEPGDYEIDVSARNDDLSNVTRLDVSVANGEVLSLGLVQMSLADGAFNASGGTSVSMSPAQVLPGERVVVRVEAENTGSDPATASMLGIQVPSGASVVPGSVVLDGSPVAWAMNGSWLEVDAGTIGRGESAVVQAWLETADNFLRTAVPTQGRIRYTTAGPVTEVLGSAASAVVGVTLVAPSASADFDVPVSGRAPAGSIVRVTADGILLAEVEATDGDTWQTMIRLPETPLPRFWELQAEADSAVGVLRSSRRFVGYDPSHVEMLEVALSQEDGGRVVFDPTRGVAQFPFVAQSGAPFRVEIEFSDPERVPSATVFLGRLRAVATYDPFYDAHVAVLEPNGFDDLGKLRVFWRPEPEQLDLTPDPPPPPFDLDDVRAQLGAPYNTFEDAVVVDGTTDSIVSMVFPDLEGIELTAEYSFDPALYSPTQDDLDRAHASGAPIYDIDVGVTVDTDSVFEIRFTGFIPDNPIPPGFPPTGSMPGQALEVVARYTAGAKAVALGPQGGPISIQNAAGAVGKLVGLRGALEDKKVTDDEWDKLEGGADLTIHCSSEALSMYEGQADDIADYILARTGVKVAMTIMGLVGGPVGILVAVAGFGADKAMQIEIENSINRLIRDIQGDPRCQPPEPDPEQQEEEDADDAGEPKWIFDPSGYTYELFEDNRLEGVTATVQFSASSSGPWEIWDAEWFLQDNPLITDPEGRYGWDVPEGFWRVRFEKGGYETAYSEVLEVLPPHFDVNVGLTSLSAPAIESVAAYVDESYIDVTFEGYMLSAFLTDFNVTLLGPGDAPVPFTLEAVDQRTTGGGDDVLRTLRFVLEGPLVLGDGYAAVFDQAVQTYAGIPGEGGIDVRFEVEEPPPPTTTTTTTTSAPTTGPVNTIPETGVGDAARASASLGAIMFALGLVLLLTAGVLGRRRRRRLET